VGAICIGEEEMEAFARASGDLNPVHLPGPSTAEGLFDAPVAYGSLGVLAALAAAVEDSDRGLQALEATFTRPLRVGTRYDLRARREPPRLSARVDDADLPALRLDARFAGGLVSPAVGAAERLGRPRHRRIEDLAPGTSVRGSYGADSAALGCLRERFALPPSAVGDGLLQALLCTSYLVGMELPGSGSLLARLRLALGEAGPGAAAGAGGEEPLSYRATVVEVQPEVRLVTLAGELRHRGGVLATLACEAHLPPPPAPLDAVLLERELGGGREPLRGRAALVVGGSRGLGGALAAALASRGCSVYACSRGGAAPELAAAASRGTIEAVPGDAADPDHCLGVLRRVTDRHGGLDLLLCCAAPRLEGIGFGPAPIGRFNEFVQRSVELVSVPMATTMHALEASGGACLVVSSEAVKTMPREWGHYVAAKGAVEALAAWAARRSPRVRVLVARVPRLAGGPLVGEGVAREAAAAWLVCRLATGSGAGGAQLLEWPGGSQL
jgi:NADP-dependent 3-hydroxy acid dehydrogenase YdfG